MAVINLNLYWSAQENSVRRVEIPDGYSQLYRLLPHILRHDPNCYGMDPAYPEIKWMSASNLVFELASYPGIIFKINSGLKTLMGATVSIRERYHRHIEVGDRIRQLGMTRIRTSAARVCTFNNYFMGKDCPGRDVDVLIEEKIDAFPNTLKELRNNPEQYNDHMKEYAKLIVEEGFSDVKPANFLIERQTGMYVLIDTDEKKGAGKGIWGMFPNRPGLIKCVGSYKHLKIVQEIAERHGVKPSWGDEEMKKQMMLNHVTQQIHDLYPTITEAGEIALLAGVFHEFIVKPAE